MTNNDLMVILSSINSNAILVCSVVTTFATVVLAWYTSRYVCLTKDTLNELRREKEPNIVIDFDRSSDLDLYFIVKNIGLSPANNIAFKQINGLEWINKNKVNPGLVNINPFKDGIFYMAPGSQLKYLIKHFHCSNDIEKENTKLSLTMSYQKPSNQIYQQRVDLDLSSYMSNVKEK